MTCRWRITPGVRATPSRNSTRFSREIGRARLADEMRRAVGGRADVRRRGLKDADAAAIAAALAPGAPGDGVVGLDASENAFTRVGVEALASALRGARGRRRSLAHVTVRGNPGATYDRANDRAGLPTDAAQSLAGACAANFLAATGEGEALKSVADRGLGDHGARKSPPRSRTGSNRSDAYARSARNTTASGPAGAEARARAFGNLPRLDEWAAYSNRFGPEGAVAVARRMHTHTHTHIARVGSGRRERGGRRVRGHRGGDRGPPGDGGTPPRS